MLYSAAQLYITDMDTAGTPVDTVSISDLVSKGYIQKEPGGSATFTVTKATTTAKAKVTLAYTPAGKKEAITLGE